MKKIAIVFILVFIGVFQIQAQKYFTKTGEISFFSSTPIEDIEAISNSASSVFDMESGKIQWAVLVKSFEFEKALMQEHFNENYMESNKYPKATFKGVMADLKKLNLTKDGNYSIPVNGTLLIHGITKTIETTAEFKIEKGLINAISSLSVEVADFGIEIPSVVSENIAKEIEIKIKANYEALD